jgi:hypothetical protein
MLIITLDSNLVFSSTTENNTGQRQEPSQEEIDESIRQNAETSRSIERFGLFADQCNNLIESIGVSQIPTCDSVVQRFNIDVGKTADNRIRSSVWSMSYHKRIHS